MDCNLSAEKYNKKIVLLEQKSRLVDLLKETKNPEERLGLQQQIRNINTMINSEDTLFSAHTMDKDEEMLEDFFEE